MRTSYHSHHMLTPHIGKLPNAIDVEGETESKDAGKIDTKDVNSPTAKQTSTKQFDKQARLHDERNNDAEDQTMPIDTLAPISSPAPVYISPETSLILAEEDEEETTILESAPTTSRLLSSPPADTDGSFEHGASGIGRSGSERATVVTSNTLEHTPSKRPQSLPQIVTPPSLHHPSLLEDDAEFLADFLMQAKNKREARSRSLSDETDIYFSTREPVPPKEKEHVDNETEPSFASPEQKNLDLSDDAHQTTSEELQVNDGQLSLSRLRDAHAQKKMNKVDAPLKYKNMGLKKHMKGTSNASRQSKIASVPAFFDSIAITRRVKDSSYRKAISSSDISKNVEHSHDESQNRYPALKLHVKLNSDDPILLRQIYLNTQKNTKFNKGNAKRAPTVLRRMKLEAKRKHSTDNSENEWEDTDEKPKNTSSKRVRWNEKRLVEYIDENDSDVSSEETEQENDEDAVGEPDGDTSTDRDSSPDPIAEAEAAPVQKPQLQTVPIRTKPVSPKKNKAVSKTLPRASRLSHTSAIAPTPAKTKSAGRQRGKHTGLSTTHNPINSFSLSPTLSFGGKRTKLRGGKTVDVSSDPPNVRNKAKCKKQ